MDGWMDGKKLHTQKTSCYELLNICFIHKAVNVAWVFTWCPGYQFSENDGLVYFLYRLSSNN